jgi:hypothetical protein
LMRGAQTGLMSRSRPARLHPADRCERLCMRQLWAELTPTPIRQEYS